MIDIQDDYTHLTFKTCPDRSVLKAGMMVQAFEINEVPFRWRWFELDDKLIQMLQDPQKLLRLPAY